MNGITHVFSIGWVEALLTVICTGIGIWISSLKRSNGKLVYQTRWQLVIGGPKASLSEFVQVLYKGTAVPRLLSTRIYIWNAGQAPIKRHDLTSRDPLRFKLEGGGTILDVSILKASLVANHFGAHVVVNSPNVIEFDFDFLNRKDGAVVQILHTAQARQLTSSGAIVGIEEGIKNLDNTLGQPFDNSFRKTVWLGLSVFIPLYLILYISSLERFTRLTAELSKHINACAAGGIVGVLLNSAWTMLRGRRRWPTTLNIDDDCV